ncbi:hypothetical protein HanIR_Chr05g0231021 [Helianthus annuus]|nr:hypothetical protein HanIR_Chr05g0231021 [Helianthus annuus]
MTSPIDTPIPNPNVPAIALTIPILTPDVRLTILPKPILIHNFITSQITTCSQTQRQITSTSHDCDSKQKQPNERVNAS